MKGSVFSLNQHFLYTFIYFSSHNLLDQLAKLTFCYVERLLIHVIKIIIICFNEIIRGIAVGGLFHSFATTDEQGLGRAVCSLDELLYLLRLSYMDEHHLFVRGEKIVIFTYCPGRGIIVILNERALKVGEKFSRLIVLLTAPTAILGDIFYRGYRV